MHAQGLRRRGIELSTRGIALSRFAFCHFESMGTPEEFSPLNGWPTCTPVNTSRTSSRIFAHDSGPMRIATPYTVTDFHCLSPIITSGVPKYFERSTSTTVVMRRLITLHLTSDNARCGDRFGRNP